KTVFIYDGTKRHQLLQQQPCSPPHATHLSSPVLRHPPGRRQSVAGHGLSATIFGLAWTRVPVPALPAPLGPWPQSLASPRLAWPRLHLSHILGRRSCSLGARRRPSPFVIVQAVALYLGLRLLFFAP